MIADSDNRAAQQAALVDLLERAERRLTRAVQAAHAADYSRILRELATLACLTHMSTNVARAMAALPGGDKDHADRYTSDQR